MTERAEVGGYHSVVDFNVHGLIGVRLINASADDVAAVTRQIGALQAPLLDEPDVTLRFVRYYPAAHLCYLGRWKQGFTDDAFFVFEEGLNGAKVRIPFDKLGGPCEIVCESGLQSVPLLLPILGLTALAKGYVAVHASALVHNGVGILMPGWAHSGKTTALLGFATLAAEFVGEEWVLLSGDGQKMYGLPTEIAISSAHLETLPGIRHAIEPSRLWQCEGLSMVSRMLRAVLGKRLAHTLVGKGVHKVITELQGRTTPKIAPPAIFINRVAKMAAKPDKLFLLVNHDDPCIQVEPTPPSKMASRIAPLVHHEQMKFMEHYLAFTFAFPRARNPFIECAPQLQLTILLCALAGMNSYTIRHPYPLVFSDFYEKVASFCDAPEMTRTEPVCALR